MQRNFPFVIFAFFLFLSPRLFAQDFDNAGVYLDYINKQRNNVSKKFMSYASASAHGKKARKVENLRNSLLNEVQESKMNINAMPSYKGDKTYRDSAVSFMKLYYNVLNEDYSKIINMEDVAEQSYDDMEAYMTAKELVDKKLEDANEMIRLTQRAFAASNNINLVEGKSELGEMMKQVHEMNKYYNVLYLIFFKPFKQEVYMMDAMDKANVTGIEQNKNALAKYATEGIEKLKDIKDFQGDNSMVNSCRGVLNFFIKEADKTSNVSDYFLAREKFETIKKDFEKKSDHSKEEVDNYNKAINDINKASQSFNNTNDQLNQMRQEALNNWNRTVDKFFDEYTPHYK